MSKPVHIKPIGIILPPTIRQRYKMTAIGNVILHIDKISESAKTIGLIADAMIKEDLDHEKDNK